MTRITAKGLVKDLPSLSSLPAVVKELETALDEGLASMEELGEIVKKDPDLTARLLKLANSSFYGFPKGVETVGEGLSLIGIEQMKQLLTGSTVIEYFSTIPAGIVNMRSFWEHSIATGIAAKIIAVLRRAPDPELYFVSGLIHDVGRLIFYLQLPEESAKLFEIYDQGDEQSLLELEESLFGFNHAHLAGELLVRWGFPNSLIESVRHHHDPKKDGLYFTDAAIVNIADFIVHALDIGNSGERYIPPFFREAWERLDLPETALRTIIRETDRQFEDVVSLFI
jgi:HD-like signal output (HDOD) protein